jgi:hypothetical protein
MIETCWWMNYEENHFDAFSASAQPERVCFKGSAGTSVYAIRIVIDRRLNILLKLRPVADGLQPMACQITESVCDEQKSGIRSLELR